MDDAVMYARNLFGHIKVTIILSPLRQTVFDIFAYYRTHSIIYNLMLLLLLLNI